MNYYNDKLKPRLKIYYRHVKLNRETNPTFNLDIIH
jgi:hypothetical protein